MNDSGKIIAGLLVAVVVITLPLWYHAAFGIPTAPPQLKYPTNATECVRATPYMKSFHMDLLNDWRNEVVRDNDRYFTTADGQVHEKSLSLTCMKCHSDKTEFCDKCHDYAGVEPYCWDCHVAPEEVSR